MQLELLAIIFGQKFSSMENFLAHLRVHVFREASFPFYEGIVGMGPWQSRHCYQYRNEHFEELIILGECDRLRNTRALVGPGAIYLNCMNFKAIP